MEQRSFSKDNIGVEALIGAVGSEFREHKPVVIPTDTLYGIACPWRDGECVKRIMEIKERPEGKTLSVSVAEMDSLRKIAVVNGKWEGLIKGNLPGPVTFVLKAKKTTPDIFLQDGKIAIRIPESDIVRRISREFGPLALTSANISGRKGARSSSEVIDQLGDREILLIADDLSVSGDPSTIIDVSGDKPLLLRAGNIMMHEIMGKIDG